MKVRTADLYCPRCKADLRSQGEQGGELGCEACDARYPVVLGIPDLRVFPDPYIDIEADRDKGRRLAERFHDFDFASFVEFYYSITDVVPPRHARAYARGVLAGVARAEAALAQWEAHLRPAGEPAASLLDVGCGTAPLLVAAAGRYRTLVGVDIAFRWLVVAKKRLAEAGLEIPLVCACAEALPFAHASFDRVALDSAIEHFRDQPGALHEVRRVTRPGGAVFVTTPNRLSLGPDPHLGLWASWLVPPPWLAAYARRQGAIRPKRRLLTPRALRWMLRASGFASPRLFLPDLARQQLAGVSQPLRLAAQAYRIARRLPVTRHFLAVFGPLVCAVARREPAPS